MMKSALVTVLSFLVSLTACVTLPGTNKKAFIPISREQENQMGDQAYQEVLAKEKVAHDARLNEILQRVGKRISAVTPVQDYQWQFTLIQSKEMNAFCLPGGKVAFYTGIVPVLEDEGAMAVVMGHEVAHAVLRHGSQRMVRELGVQGVLAILNIGLGNSDQKALVLGALGVGAQVGMELPFSRGNESEADEFGLRYAAMAGYDPSEAVRFWQRFSKATESSGKPPKFLSTHPPDEERIEALSQEQAEAQALYAKSPRYGIGEKL